MEFKDDKQLEKQRMEEIDALPTWLRAFYDAFDPFLSANGWEKFKGCYVYEKALMEPEWALWTFAMPTNLEGIRQVNYNLLKALGNCPCIINDCAVLYFDEIDGNPVAFVQENYLRAYQWFDKIDRWLQSDDNYDKYFLSKIGFAPTKLDMQNG